MPELPLDRHVDRHRDPLHRRPGPSVRVRVSETRPDRADLDREDRLATEEPLEIRLGWPGRDAHRVWVTMRTPGSDFELAAGWVTHEGLAGPMSGVPDLQGVAYCTDVALRPEQEFNVVTVTLRDAPAREVSQHGSVTAGSSACGVCGTDSLDDVLAKVPDLAALGERPAPLDPDVVRGLPDRLRERQPLFSRTGGVHAAGLVDAGGELLVVREDVGRHNAVDKVTGARVLAGEPIAGAAMVVSGRAGFELVQKALVAGVGTLVAVGAPTSLSVALARRGGLALYGFTRPDRAVRYC